MPTRLAALAVAVVLLAGCSSSQLADFNEQVVELRQQSARLDAVIAEGEAIADTLPPGKERDDVLAGIDEARKHKAVIDSTADDYLARIEQLPKDANEWDALKQGAGAVSASLPPPYQQVVAGAGLIFGLLGEWRRRRIKSAAGKVINAIEDAKDDTGSVKFADPVVEARLRSKMGSDGQALVRKLK